MKKKDMEKNNQLIHAVDAGDFELVKKLHSEGASVRASCDYALKKAARIGHLAMVQYLCTNGADVNGDQNEALINASTYGHYDIVKYLCEHGANTRRYGHSALSHAINAGHTEIVKYFFENGIGINGMSINDVATGYLRYLLNDIGISFNQYCGVIEYLCRNGANINVGHGAALKWACQNKLTELVIYLLHNGAKINEDISLSSYFINNNGYFSLVHRYQRDLVILEPEIQTELQDYNKRVIRVKRAEY